MSAQAWFYDNEVDITPGTSAVLRLSIENLSATTDTFTITPVGLAAGWTTLRPATVTLFGGAHQDIEVDVHPPLLPSTTAGQTSLSVRIVPESDPDDIRTAETMLQVAASVDRHINILQPALRARRTAVFEMMLENRGNTLASCRLHLIDPSGRVLGDFDPPAAGVEPGAGLLIRLRVRAGRWQWQRRPRTVPFRVDADQPGCPTTTASATFVQAPLLPERFGAWLAGAAIAAGLLVGVWFAVLKPAIDDAAADAVAELTLSAAPSDTLPDGNTVDPGTASTVATTLPPAEVDDGRPYAGRLSSNVPAGQTGRQSITVPAGQHLLVTDLILQNPNSDGGTASLLRGNDVLFTWRLDYILTDVPQAFVTPIEVASGEQLVFEVMCTAAGDPAIGACSPALQALGLLVPDQ